jgi:hypothetical protein
MSWKYLPNLRNGISKCVTYSLWEKPLRRKAPILQSLGGFLFSVQILGTIYLNRMQMLPFRPEMNEVLQILLAPIFNVMLWTASLFAIFLNSD